MGCAVVGTGASIEHAQAKANMLTLFDEHVRSIVITLVAFSKTID
jgi:hypothetical protein